MKVWQCPLALLPRPYRPEYQWAEYSVLVRLYRGSAMLNITTCDELVNNFVTGLSYLTELLQLEVGLQSPH